MFDADLEKESRKSLIGTIKVGDSVIVVGLGDYRGQCGTVESITDDGQHDRARVKIGCSVSFYLRDLVRKWPGLEPGRTPVGGWAKLHEKQKARAPVPEIGQRVQSMDTHICGRVSVLGENGHVGYELDKNHPITGRMAWETPQKLKVQTFKLGLHQWSNYARDVVAETATPIRDLPEPYRRIRKVAKVGGVWEAQDEAGNPIGVLLDMSGAYNIAVQLFWEFGL